MPLDVSEETSVSFLASGLERPPDILQEMHVADLDDAARKDILCRHPNGLVLVASDAAERIVHVLELREELHERLKVLRRREEAGRNATGAKADSYVWIAPFSGLYQTMQLSFDKLKISIIIWS